MAKSTEPNQLDLISFNLAFKTDWKLIFELILIAHETMLGYNATGTVLLNEGNWNRTKPVGNQPAGSSSKTKTVKVTISM